MKNILVSFVTFVVIVSGISASFADTYVSGNLGAVIVNDSDLDEGALSGEFTFDAGFGFLVAVGTSMEPDKRSTSKDGGRVELELGYRQNDVDKIKIDGIGSSCFDGDFNSLSLMANLYYDVFTEGSFSPFIGAGVGFARVELDSDDFGDEDDTVVAGQFIFGASYASSETLMIDLQYRYFATDDPKFDGVHAEYRTHNLMIGVRHSF